MNNWTDETFAAYVAGFMDGEGSIEIHPQECGVRIRIANIYLPALSGIRERLGFGKVEAYKRPAKFKQLYAYCCSNATDCRSLLVTVRPYLTVKAKRADYALEVIARMQARMDALDTRNRSVLEMINSGARQIDVARQFGVSQALISRIKSGHTWPCEIKQLNARRGLKKFIRPKDAIFRLHGEPLYSPADQQERSFPLAT
jgi:hypothetical protein